MLELAPSFNKAPRFELASPFRLEILKKHPLLTPSNPQRTVTHNHLVRYTEQMALKIFKIVRFSTKCSRGKYAASA